MFIIYVHKQNYKKYLNTGTISYILLLYLINFVDIGNFLRAYISTVSSMLFNTYEAKKYIHNFLKFVLIY